MSTPLLDLIDITDRKHRGSQESRDAHDRVVQTKRIMHERIMRLVQARGDFGATSKEIAYALGKQLHAISGRCSELVMQGRLKKSGLRRAGAAVLLVR